MRIGVRHLRHRGTAILEAGLVLPVFLLLILGIFEYGRYMAVRNVMENAAREGARFAVVHTADKTTADVQNLVDSTMSNLRAQLDSYNLSSSITVTGIDQSGATITWSDAKFGEVVVVTVSGSYRPITAGFLKMPSAITMSASSAMRSEAN